jgi:hypothetical protein
MRDLMGEDSEANTLSGSYLSRNTSTNSVGGARFRAERIPLEPDPGYAGEGKQSAIHVLG